LASTKDQAQSTAVSRSSAADYSALPELPGSPSPQPCPSPHRRAQPQECRAYHHAQPAKPVTNKPAKPTTRNSPPPRPADVSCVMYPRPMHTPSHATPTRHRPPGRRGPCVFVVGTYIYIYPKANRQTRDARMCAFSSSSFWLLVYYQLSDGRLDYETDAGPGPDGVQAHSNRSPRPTQVRACSGSGSVSE
jgi:hypothetical protein